MTVMTDTEYANAILGMMDQVQGDFEPFILPNDDGDCVEFFVSPKEFHAKRVDDYLTLYLEDDTNEIAGFVVKNISRILAAVSANDIDHSFVIRNGEMCLEAMFAAMVWNDDRRLVYVRDYRRVANIAKSYKIDKIQVPAGWKYGRTMEHVSAVKTT